MYVSTLNLNQRELAANTAGTPPDTQPHLTCLRAVCLIVCACVAKTMRMLLMCLLRYVAAVVAAIVAVIAAIVAVVASIVACIASMLAGVACVFWGELLLLLLLLLLLQVWLEFSQVLLLLLLLLIWLLL